MQLLLTPAELAKTLGLSTQTIYNRLHNPECGPLPAITRLSPKSHPRFAVDDVKAWVMEKKGAPRALPEFPPKAPRRGRPTKAEQIARRQAEGT